MNLDELKIGDVKRIASAFTSNGETATPTAHDGFKIVVLDRGFVYVGDVTVDRDWCVIRDARNLRIWGTDEGKPGLGYLAANGPTAKTKADSVGTVRAPLRAVITLIDTEASKWNAR